MADWLALQEQYNAEHPQNNDNDNIAEDDIHRDPNFGIRVHADVHHRHDDDTRSTDSTDAGGGLHRVVAMGVGGTALNAGTVVIGLQNVGSILPVLLSYLSAPPAGRVFMTHANLISSENQMETVQKAGYTNLKICWNK